MNTISEEINCQLLKLGDTSWKRGKLRIQAIANYNLGFLETNFIQETRFLEVFFDQNKNSINTIKL